MDQISTELQATLDASKKIYSDIQAHMEELLESPFYTTYAEYTAAQGKTDNYIVANLKKIIIGVVICMVIGCGIWFMAALIPEFSKCRKDETSGKEAAAK